MNPPNTMSVAQQLLHSTIRIECRDKRGDLSSGMGFNFSFEIDGMFVPVIITNRHVFQNATQVDFHYTLADREGLSTGQHERYSIMVLKRFGLIIQILMSTLLLYQFNHCSSI